MRIVKLLQEGKVDALVAQKGLEQGALTIEYLFRYLNGEDIPTETVTGGVLITRDNLAETEQWVYPE